MKPRRVTIRFDSSTCVLLLLPEGEDGWRVSYEGVDLGVLKEEKVRWRFRGFGRIYTTRWTWGEQEFYRMKHALLNMAFKCPAFWESLQQKTWNDAILLQDGVV